MRQVIVAVAVFAIACASAFSQAKSLGSGPQRMELTLDRREGSTWRTVDPGLVFAKDDQVRFRFRTNFDGFLHVMNQSTSGNYEMLFPRQDTGKQNRIEAGVEYVVPATQGWFSNQRAAGPRHYLLGDDAAAARRAAGVYADAAAAQAWSRAAPSPHYAAL